MSLLLDPLQTQFFQRALLATVLVGIVCPVLGSYVVLRGMAFIGDALAHIILPGVVVAFLLGIPPVIGALTMGVLTALGLTYLGRDNLLKQDTAIGILFAGAFALGVALLSVTDGYATDLTHFLFGNLLAVSQIDLLVMGLLSAIVIGVVVLFFKELLVISFDPVLATTLNLPTRFLETLLLVLIAVTIVIALQAIGIALMIALLVTPAATASLLTRRLPSMMLIGALIGTLSGIIGLYLSFYFDIAAGPAVVLVATVIFALVYSSKTYRSNTA